MGNFFRSSPCVKSRSTRCQVAEERLICLQIAQDGALCPSDSASIGHKTQLVVGTYGAMDTTVVSVTARKNAPPHTFDASDSVIGCVSTLLTFEVCFLIIFHHENSYT